MGFCIAAEAAGRGHDVRLLTGPVCLDIPSGVEVSRFETVEELYALACAALEDADCLVMAAAPGDYRPASRIAGKHKKQPSFALELVATRDVLASLAVRKADRIFVGFAVETNDALENARKKIQAKSLDFIVLNTPASFGRDRADFTFVFPGGRTRPLGTVAKTDVAAAILNEVEIMFHQDNPREV